jgi:hypothetical protein
MSFVCGFLSFSVINPKAKSMGNFGCNLLLPIGYIFQTPEEEKLKLIPKPRKRFQKKQTKHTPRSSDESSSSSSEEDYTLVRQESTLPYNVVSCGNTSTCSSSSSSKEIVSKFLSISSEAPILDSESNLLSLTDWTSPSYSGIFS